MEFITFQNGMPEHGRDCWFKTTGDVVRVGTFNKMPELPHDEPGVIIGEFKAGLSIGDTRLICRGKIFYYVYAGYSTDPKEVISWCYVDKPF